EAAKGTKSPPTRARLNLALLAGSLAFSLLFLTRSHSVQLHTEAKTDGTIPYPKAGAEFVRDKYASARLFNSYPWGGYLINALYPQKVFIDGRSDMYGDDLLNSYLDVTSLHQNWQQVLDEYAVDL